VSTVHRGRAARKGRNSVREQSEEIWWSSWSAVVGAEMVRSDEGVGWMIVRGMNTGNTLQIMVGMVAIGIVGFLLATLTSALERRLCAWNEQKGM